MNKKFPFLYATGMALLGTVYKVLNLIITIIYMSLPLWFFMLIMQLRDKNNKATAIGTFVKDNSEFQYVFPNYILVAVEPTSLKKWHRDLMRQIYSYFYTNRWLLTVGLLLIIVVFLLLHFFIL